MGLGRSLREDNEPEIEMKKFLSLKKAKLLGAITFNHELWVITREWLARSVHVDLKGEPAPVLMDEQSNLYQCSIALIQGVEKATTTIAPSGLTYADGTFYTSDDGAQFRLLGTEFLIKPMEKFTCKANPEKNNERVVYFINDAGGIEIVLAPMRMFSKSYEKLRKCILGLGQLVPKGENEMTLQHDMKYLKSAELLSRLAGLIHSMGEETAAWELEQRIPEICDSEDFETALLTLDDDGVTPASVMQLAAKVFQNPTDQKLITDLQTEALLLDPHRLAERITP